MIRHVFSYSVHGTGRIAVPAAIETRIIGTDRPLIDALTAGSWTLVMKRDIPKIQLVGPVQKISCRTAALLDTKGC